MRNYRYCPKCGKIEIYTCDICGFCKTDLVETDIEYAMRDWFDHEQEITQRIYDEYKVKENPLYDPEFVAKREKRDKEIEKLTFAPPTRSNVGKVNQPKCPTCGSTNIEKISTGKKALGFAAVGLFSKNLGKTFHCKNCGYRW